MSNHPAASKEFWHQLYLEERTNWDLGGPHPQIVALHNQVMSLSQKKELSVYVPGMGNGHCPAFFQQNCHKVTGVDLSDKAVENAKQKYGSLEKLILKVGNAITDSEPNNIDLVYDRAVLCALPHSSQTKYLKKSVERLKSKGMFATILFTKVHNEQGPPWAISVEDLQKRMAALGCELIYRKDLAKVDYESSSIAKESIVIFQKP